MEAIAAASTVGISTPQQYRQQMFLMTCKPRVAAVRRSKYMVRASGINQDEAARDSMLVQYLQEKGYGSLSLEEVEERQRRLGIFGSSDPLFLLRDTEATRFLQPEMSDYSSLHFQASTEYLKEKGYGSLSLEEVTELQQRLGLFASSDRDEGMSRRAVEGPFEQGPKLDKDYGVDTSKDKGELHGGFPSYVERIKLMTTGLGAANWLKTFQKGSGFKNIVTNYSKKSQSSIQPRSRWILDACFVIDLLQKPSNEKERIATEACVRAFEKIQAEGAIVLMPEVCVAEASHFLNRQGVQYRLLYAILQGAFTTVSMEMGDWQRTKELFDLYASRNGVSIPDCCLVSIAETMKIVNLGTLDYRHFQRLIKPKHIEMFSIIP